LGGRSHSSRRFAFACVLEGLSAGDVVVVAVRIDDVPDRLARHFLDLVDVGRHRLRTAQADRVGGDDALGGDDEHRLVPLIAEHVDIVGALHLGGGEHRRRGLGAGRRDGEKQGRGEDEMTHGDLPWE
jgi:hypothetical protein